ncbi:hypothetical protein Bpfe_009752 [Biomphalaria pfeifferi]|uniref:Uncharacterized protein n=1 Tax=Biomphalaria pfeifferi TaxID=112525 RepID=A0AAD8BUJ1_BIOPF|nr:hypothetical protein Bpfe_009752 [Biomphalaria pfeifferi]
MEVEDVEYDPATQVSKPDNTEQGAGLARNSSSVNKKDAKKNTTDSKIITVQTKNTNDAQNKTKKDIIQQPVQKGIQMAGDFFGRMATLIVMVVTTINTTIVCVNDLTNGNYWSGGLHAFLLAFIHIPVIVIMIWLMIKAKVQSIYRKIRPGKVNENIIVTEINEFDGQITEVLKEIPKEQKSKVDKATTLLRKGEQLGKTLEGGQINKAFE